MCDGEGGGVLLDETLYEAYEFKKMTSREDFLIRDKLDKIDEIKSGKCFNIFQMKKKIPNFLFLRLPISMKINALLLLFL